MKNTLYLSFIVALFASVALLSPAQPAYAQTQVAVIVNPNNPVTSLDAGKVRLFWLRRIKKRWPNNNKFIRPADYNFECPEQQEFYSKILKMNSDKVEKYFMTRQYQNAEKPQDKFGSAKEVIDFVSKNEGAIGFVAVKDIQDAKKVKVVFKMNQ
ncbi:hypothetical protein [Persicobacter psychrovividus]|uniref:PBP domain-containing protein n=1 Tax=Persicobacter psychrovividus TaxID=387638 RepID=A0ABN6LCJ2_9BACT|nr:hypothetical protein PEPS_31840 [Persicobacter psychrovividus]